MTFTTQNNKNSIDWNVNTLSFYIVVDLSETETYTIGYKYFPHTKLLRLSTVDYYYTTTNSDSLKRVGMVYHSYDYLVHKTFSDEMSEEQLIEMFETNHWEDSMTSQIDKLIDRINSCSEIKENFEEIDWSQVKIEGIRELSNR